MDKYRIADIVIGILFIILFVICGNYLFGRSGADSGRDKPAASTDENYPFGSLSSNIERLERAVVMISDGEDCFTGLVVNDKGYIITAGNVNNSKHKVYAHGKEKSIDYKIVSAKATEVLGVSLLKINPKDVSETIVLGNSDDLLPGESIYTISSLGGISGSITHGIVSSIHKTASKEGRTYNDISYTDALISKGSIGGGVFDSRGNMLGVIFDYSTDEGNKTSGQGCIIPINNVKQFLKVNVIEYEE